MSPIAHASPELVLKLFLYRRQIPRLRRGKAISNRFVAGNADAVRLDVKTVQYRIGLRQMTVQAFYCHHWVGDMVNR